MVDFYDARNEDTSIISYDISVIPNDFNVLTINSLVQSGIISMPTFQRNYVWDRKRASKFIESLILGLPIPQLFFYQVERNKYSVIDGQQRLLSIYFFIKQRFPRGGKRAILRKIFDDNGHIPDDVLSNNQYFQDFKLLFAKQENGEPHPLSGKKYLTLDEERKRSFELMPIRCMSIRQNKPEDNGSIYEIFSRLNTGGLNLSAQEIRGCLYNSDFYKMLYDINSDNNWRKLIGKKEEDDKFRDVEILLRSFALLLDENEYAGSMVQFLNRFSKKAQNFNEDKILELKSKFYRFLELCKNINDKDFLSKTGSLNISLFDSVFVSVVENIDLQNPDKDKFITKEDFDALKSDEEFKNALTHSTSHVESVKTRLRLSRKYISNKI